MLMGAQLTPRLSKWGEAGLGALGTASGARPRLHDTPWYLRGCAVACPPTLNSRAPNKKHRERNIEETRTPEGSWSG
eukprot:6138088-Pyramimonas_sp.AAC.1